MKTVLVIGVTILLGLSALAYLRLRDPNRVGRFRSEAGKVEFQMAYDEAMTLIPAPGETRDIETAYGTVRVYYFTKEENRTREPIVLLPGRSASTPMWQPNLEGLMKERPVYTIDMLGEPGMSRQTREIRDKKDQAEWLNQVLEELGLQKAHIVGVSIGGWTAMNLARFYPEGIASVSLLDPVFVFAPISFKVIALSIPATVPLVPQSIREKMLSTISGGAKTDESVPIARLIETGMRNFELKLPAPDPFSDEDLKSIRVPILALMAGKSIMHNSERAVENGKRYVRDIQIESWPKASHAINGEYPEDVVSRILGFVRDKAKD